MKTYQHWPMQGRRRIWSFTWILHILSRLPDIFSNLKTNSKPCFKIKAGLNLKGVPFSFRCHAAWKLQPEVTSTKLPTMILCYRTSVNKINTIKIISPPVSVN